MNVVPLKNYNKHAIVLIFKIQKIQTLHFAGF